MSDPDAIAKVAELKAINRTLEYAETLPGMPMLSAYLETATALEARGMLERTGTNAWRVTDAGTAYHGEMQDLITAANLPNQGGTPSKVEQRLAMCEAQNWVCPLCGHEMTAPGTKSEDGHRHHLRSATTYTVKGRLIAACWRCAVYVPNLPKMRHAWLLAQQEAGRE